MSSKRSAKKKPKKTFKSIIDKFEIDETLTKPMKKEKNFHHVKDNVNLTPNYNMMSDVLFLPTTKEGYRYLLTVCDIATDACDFEPIKDKEPTTILESLKTIFKRKYLDQPYASLRTDSGTEYLGAVKKYLHDNNILHRIALPARHKQVGNVEALNNQLARILNGYMNKIELKTGKVYREWTDILPTVRKELNEYRKKTKAELKEIEEDRPLIDYSIQPKFEIGDIVYRKLDHPESATGEKQDTAQFRVGDLRWDRQPRKIEKVLFYHGGASPYRYILNGLPNASYGEIELKPAQEKEELFEVKQLLDKKVIDGEVHYLTWYYNEKKKEASWQPESELNKFVPDIVKDYNESLKTNTKTKKKK